MVSVGRKDSRSAIRHHMLPHLQRFQEVLLARLRLFDFVHSTAPKGADPLGET